MARVRDERTCVACAALVVVVEVLRFSWRLDWCTGLGRAVSRPVGRWRFRVPCGFCLSFSEAVGPPVARAPRTVHPASRIRSPPCSTSGFRVPQESRDKTRGSRERGATADGDAQSRSTPRDSRDPPPRIMDLDLEVERRRQVLEALFDGALRPREPDRFEPSEPPKEIEQSPRAPPPRPVTAFAPIAPGLLKPIRHATPRSERGPQLDVQQHNTCRETQQRNSQQGPSAVFLSPTPDRTSTRRTRKATMHKGNALPLSALGPAASAGGRAVQATSANAPPPLHSHYFRSHTPQLALFADRVMTPADARVRGPGMYYPPGPAPEVVHRHYRSVFVSNAPGAAGSKPFRSIATDLEAQPNSTVGALERGFRSSANAPSSRGHAWPRSPRTAPPVGAVGHMSPLYDVLLR